MPDSLVGLNSTIKLNRLFHSGSSLFSSIALAVTRWAAPSRCGGVERLLLHRLHPICFAFDHQRPEDAGILGGQRHGRAFVASALDQGLRPDTEPVLFVLDGG